jgi:hypothetical protein
MKSSTAWPALTSSTTRRGFLRHPISSSIDFVPMILVPLASLARKSSTLETVRLNAATVKPWSFMLRMRFWPITARPMSPMSAFASLILKAVGFVWGVNLRRGMRTRGRQRGKSKRFHVFVCVCAAATSEHDKA